MCEENVERTHDENEREAMYAIIYAAASRGKGKRQKLPEIKELYDRNADPRVASRNLEDVLNRQKEAEKWLSNFDLSKL